MLDNCEMYVLGYHCPVLYYSMMIISTDELFTKLIYRYTPILNITQDIWVRMGLLLSPIEPDFELSSFFTCLHHSSRGSL